MVRFLVILVVVGVFGYLGYSIVINAPSDRTVQGIAQLYVRATIDNDKSRIEMICEPGVSGYALGVAGQLRPLLGGNPSLNWQSRQPRIGQRAISAPISGRGRTLVVEVNKHGRSYRIAAVGLM
ncbi:hypothetical protein LLG95_03975 [bacterium]|nr:hypothetical protein [bacterium]